jgi:ATP-binding cassette subfamily C protein CydD
MPTIKKSRSGSSQILTGRSLLNRFANDQRNMLRASVVAGALSTLCLCLMWITFALSVEGVIVNNDSIFDHNILISFFVASALGRVVFQRFQTLCGQIASSKIRSAIRKNILLLWRGQSPLSEHQQSPASAATQWVEDVEAMDGYFSKYWPQQALAIISPFIILCVVAYLNWLCALLLLISAPLIPLFMVLVGMGAQSLNQKYSTTRQRLAGHFLNRVANLPTIKLLNGEQSVFEEVEARSDHYRRVVMKTLRVAFLSSTVLEFFTSVAIASLAIYIGFSLYGAINWVPATSITLFSGLLILILAPEFFQPLRKLSQYYHDKASALGGADNLVALFNSAEIDSAENVAVANDATEHKGKTSATDHNAQVMSNEKQGLTLTNLSIGHNSKHVLAKNINIALEGCQLLAVTGSSGTGKTSFLNTIAHYLEPLSGSVSMFPGDFSTTPIAYLPQKPWIKNGTVLENLTEFAPQANEEDIYFTLDKLGLSKVFGARSEGLNTLVGEHGKGFSGGQLQRLALSRVLLNPTPVILLDEPTAKLDLESKEYIINALQQLKENAIVIVATHDLALVNIADRHLRLDAEGGHSNAILV